MGMNVKAGDIERDLMEAARPDKVEVLASFFKSGRGEYGEGDVFIGVSVPDNRRVARRHLDAGLDDVRRLLQSPVHEVRLCALLVLVEQYKRGDAARRREIYDFYLTVTNRINNWDLVDLSCQYIIGPQLMDGGDRSVLVMLAASESMWRRRIAVVSTLWMVRCGETDDAIGICTMLLGDREDLIRKACGWVLREVGKKDKGRLTAFLDRHAGDMSRTTLRYAIERFDRDERMHYMRLGK